MKIACLSGKGGAGKTFIATNLAAVAGKCTYIDCDVEAPNGHLFFKPHTITSQTVSTTAPVFDAQRCTGCKQCVKFCHFHALVYIKSTPMVFGEACHSCGGCAIACPYEAITYAPKAVGAIETGHHGDVTVVTGILNPGEASGVPIIKRALQQADGLTILDCPPGSACSVTETIMAADCCILVAEPTAFGFHNVQMVYELATLLGKPCGVIINKETAPYPPLDAFCTTQNLPIFMRIPYDIALAQRIGQGELVAETLPQQRTQFAHLLAQIGGLV
ncbi:4Fe-4S binding protein [Bengtsoniella intestinalis]|uniref:nucleotide-binding protein n=1 Tax=Bengtsoniella intestinalis TaxID=3073143 RepID=UPI00391FA7CA